MGIIVAGVENPMTFCRDKDVLYAARNSIGEVSGMGASSTLVRVVPTGPRQVSLHYAITIPGWSNELAEVQGRLSGADPDAMAGKLNKELMQMGSSNRVGTLSFEQSGSPAEMEEMGKVGFRLRLWIIWFGALFAILLITKNALQNANFIFPLVSHADFAVTDAIKKMKARLTNETLRLMEEAAQFDSKATRCYSSRKMLPTGFSEAARELVNDISNGVDTAAARLDYTALPPWWASTYNRVVMILLGPCLCLVLIQLIINLTGLGGFNSIVAIFDQFHSVGASHGDTTLAKASQAPAGAFICGAEGQACPCAGAIFHGGRLVHYSLPSSEVVSFPCQNESSLVAEGSDCVCDPYAQKDSVFTQGDQVIALAFTIENLDYFQVKKSKALRADIENAVRSAVAYVAGYWVNSGHVRAVFSPPNMYVRALVMPPKQKIVNILLKNIKWSMRALPTTLVDRLQKINGSEVAIPSSLNVTVNLDPKVVSSPGPSVAPAWGSSSRRLEQAESAIHCQEGSYQVDNVVLGCGTERLTLKEDIVAGDERRVIAIPAGASDVNFVIASLPGQSDIFLELRDENANAFIGKDGASLPEALDWRGSTFQCHEERSSAAGAQLACSVKSIMNFSATLWIRNHGDTKAEITMNYAYSGIDPCPAVYVGCAPFTPDIRIKAMNTLKAWRVTAAAEHPNAASAWTAACDTWAKVLNQASGATSKPEGGDTRLRRRLAKATQATGGSLCSGSGLPWTVWPLVFQDSATWKIAFHVLDKDTNAYISEDEFVKGFQGDLKSSSLRPATARLVNPLAFSEKALTANDVWGLFRTLWGNVVMFFILALTATWPVTRWLANRVLEEMEKKVQKSLIVGVRMSMQGVLEQMQRRADALLDLKVEQLQDEQKEKPSSGCIVQ
mmetsp:Transcript_13610/g.34446  ORF Transcript_13610/g.34446 Transcript_13610/m.34446 type:complete len:900 (+) Transcript_13610:2141-4840(+)